MKYKSLGKNKRVLRLERGEEIIATLVNFCKNHSINAATIQGIGSLEDITLAHYRIDSKKYSEKKLEGIFELISLLGNISFSEGMVVVHAHCTVGDEHMNVQGGHLVNAKISATAEVFIQILDDELIKSYNSEIGLKLFDFEDSL